MPRPNKVKVFQIGLVKVKNDATVSPPRSMSTDGDGRTVVLSCLPAAPYANEFIRNMEGRIRLYRGRAERREPVSRKVDPEAGRVEMFDLVDELGETA